MENQEYFNQRAYPFEETVRPAPDMTGLAYGIHQTFAVHHTGMTKLELFTMAAMQGLCAKESLHEKELAAKALRIARFTLTKLNEEAE